MHRALTLFAFALSAWCAAAPAAHAGQIDRLRADAGDRRADLQGDPHEGSSYPPLRLSFRVSASDLKHIAATRSGLRSVTARSPLVSTNTAPARSRTVSMALKVAALAAEPAGPRARAPSGMHASGGGRGACPPRARDATDGVDYTVRVRRTYRVRAHYAPL